MVILSFLIDLIDDDATDQSLVFISAPGGGSFGFRMFFRFRLSFQFYTVFIHLIDVHSDLNAFVDMHDQPHR